MPNLQDPEGATEYPGGRLSVIASDRINRTNLDMVMDGGVNRTMVGISNIGRATAQSLAPLLFGSAESSTVGIGIFLGEESGVFKLRAGDPSGNNLLWDGTNLTITGALTATSGTIGGWTLSSSALTSGSVILNATNERLLFGSATAPLTGIGIFIGKDGAAYEFRAGDPANDFIHWDGTDLVITGQITADAGAIGGWSISAAELSSGNVKIQAGAERMLFGAATAPLTGTGIFMGKDVNDYEFRVGNPSGAYMHWNGVNMTMAGSFTISSLTFFGSFDVSGNIRIVAGDSRLLNIVGNANTTCTLQLITIGDSGAKFTWDGVALDIVLSVEGNELVTWEGVSKDMTVHNDLIVSGALSVTGAITGNVATATALKTARTIGGTSFDGTANIAVALSATATALANIRTINTVNFDGTANIVVTAAAGTLTGATLTSGVTASSLTSLGTITTLAATTCTFNNTEINGALNHDGSTVGFFGTTPVVQQTINLSSIDSIGQALINLGLAVEG